jgi:hypothetical protein
VLNAPEEKEMTSVEEITERMSGNIRTLQLCFRLVASVHVLYHAKFGARLRLGLGFELLEAHRRTPHMFPSRPAFLLYTSLVVLVSAYLIWVVAPKSGSRNIFVYVTICSIVGSVSVVGVKVRNEEPGRAQCSFFFWGCSSIR